MNENELSAPPSADSFFGIDPTKFRKGLLAFCIFLLGVNLYRWLAGFFEPSGFERLRGVALAAALVAVVGAGLVRKQKLQRALLVISMLLVLAFFILFFAR